MQIQQTDEEFPLTQRLALLREIMQRADLSATAKNICWLLLVERMNSATGKCLCSNGHIAKQLAIGLTAIKDAKKQLRQTGVLETDPAGKRPSEKSPHKRSISSFRFNKGSMAGIRPSNSLKPTEPESDPVGKRPRTHQQQKHPEPVETLSIKIDGPEAQILRQAGIFIADSRTGRFAFKTNSRAAEILRTHQPAEPPVIDAPPPTDDVAQFQQWKTAFRAFPSETA